jgi:hypothetical protein
VSCTSHSAPTTRPALEVADIVRARNFEYRHARRVYGQQDRVLRALVKCRTADLGGFKAQCDSCAHVAIQYASCRNRHCPKCQTLAGTRWVEQQCAELLDIDYWHLVFTLPHELNPLAHSHPRLVYNLLFRAASRTLLEFGRNPRWLGGELGITMVLHTWGQNLGSHIHVHCIVTGGALSADRQCWISANRGFLFPTAALSKVFRGKYLDALVSARRAGELQSAGTHARGLDDPRTFECLLTRLRTHEWVVYSKPPFSGAANVLAYLGRYTHRVAIANHRLVDFDGEHVRFRWRDYAHGNKEKIMSLPADEFIRRFLLHTLPRGLARIRHYGLLANRFRKKNLSHCRELIGQRKPVPRETESVDDMMLRLTGTDIAQCPRCEHGRLRRTTIVTPLPARMASHDSTGPP